MLTTEIFTAQNLNIRFSHVHQLFVRRFDRCVVQFTKYNIQGEGYSDQKLNNSRDGLEMAVVHLLKMMPVVLLRISMQAFTQSE